MGVRSLGACRATRTKTGGGGLTRAHSYFEVFIFLAGEFGTVALAANSIAYSFIPVCFTIPLGIQVGLTSRVGDLLARGQHQAAGALMRAVFTFALGLALATGITVFFARDALIGVYTNNPRVAETARLIWPLLAGFVVLDATFGCQSGIMRAISQQAYFSGLVFGSLFVLGLPSVALLGFAFRLGLVGLWMAFPFPYVVLNVLLWRRWRAFDLASFARDVVDRESRVAVAARQSSPSPAWITSDH